MRDLSESRPTIELVVLAVIGVRPVDDVGIVVATEARLKVVGDCESRVESPSSEALEATGCLAISLGCPVSPADKGH